MQVCVPYAGETSQINDEVVITYFSLYVEVDDTRTKASFLPDYLTLFCLNRAFETKTVCRIASSHPRHVGNWTVCIRSCLLFNMSFFARSSSSLYKYRYA